jgi:signal peptidase II
LGKWGQLGLLFVVLVAFDQWTKFLAVDRLTTAFQQHGAQTLSEKVAGFYSYRLLEAFSREPYTVWQPVWRMSYVENPGAAWGMFRSLSEGTRNAFFTLISIAAVGFILYYYRRLEARQVYLRLALAMVLSGAVGNFIDRLARHYVIDFIEWYWWNRPDLRWPTFNVADSLIVVGVLMLVLQPGGKQASGDAVSRPAAAGGRSKKRSASGA